MIGLLAVNFSARNGMRSNGLAWCLQSSPWTAAPMRTFLTPWKCCSRKFSSFSYFPTLIPFRISLTRFTLVSFWSICLVWYLSIMYQTLAKSAWVKFLSVWQRLKKKKKSEYGGIPGRSMADRLQGQPVLLICQDYVDGSIDIEESWPTRTDGPKRSQMK